MKYRKKPVVIDALIWTGENHRDMFNFLEGHESDSNVMQAEGDNFYIHHGQVEGGLIIKTLEGECIARIGEYIIRGVAGEMYPCKPDIFNDTHEAI